MQRRPKIEGGQTTGAQDRLQWPYGDTRARGLRGKARRTDKSNVDSEDTEYREEILNTTLVEQRR